MELSKVQMCRICLVKDVQMSKVTNKDLQDVYEKLTDIPFITVDRPVLACVFCYTKLKECSQLRRKCLEAEKWLSRMLNEEDETKPPIKQGLVEITIAPIEHSSSIDECQLERVDIKEELPDDCEGHNDILIKEEHQTEPEYLYTYPDVEDMPKNHPESDSEDDTPLMVFKTEVEEEEVICKKKQRAAETQSVAETIIPDLYVQETRKEDTIVAQENKTEQPESPIIRNNQSVSSIVNNTALTTEGRKQTYNCDVCQRSFTKNSDLTRHYRIHTGEKPFECEICQKRFNQKACLLTHNRIHTGEKPYKCETCQKRFNQKAGLEKHIRVHTSEKPYKCEICQKGFNQAVNLKTHVRMHTGEKPYKCEICQRGFAQVSNLNKHVRLHAGERPYKCEICERSFAQLSNLNKHVCIHASEKPYKCEKCQRNFKVKSSFNKHIRLRICEKKKGKS